MDFNFKEPWVSAGRFADNLVAELRLEIETGHPLWCKDLRAIAQRTDSDDVLFEIVKSVPMYAVVHLTWNSYSGNAEVCPNVKLFSSFNHWVREGMTPDHEEFVR